MIVRQVTSAVGEIEHPVVDDPQPSASHRTLAGGSRWATDGSDRILLPALLALYHNPANGKAKPENVRASMIKSSTTSI